ncbi:MULTISPECIES: CoA pyrophosphatase [Metallosphaera]|uniref:NUDIX hydrolase n=1 Tax=Metallosphaera TaxID=41980 RepID=UPI001F070BB4|nr:CoA pyrophosphatase [Metallosphaera sedula]MCH1771591.1 CoA pyrophosphatase [Metallosphaera sedula]MCP6728190.1 CoA pyrophosphatase [Metallosphaera sedula]BBL46604.1 ADP-ribose pyrophosphatase [Metallosphaera sedula]
MECDAAVVLIFRDDGRFLLIKRADQKGDPWSGHMALPGGHREGNESCETTAVREAQEEVGITPTNLSYLGMYSPHNREMRVAVFVGHATSPQVKIDGEVDKWFWVHPSELKEEKDHFVYQSYIIWGMTYRILKDFLSARQRSSHQVQAVDQSSLKE